MRNSGQSIRAIVMRAGNVVDAVLSRRSPAALEAAKLAQ
jgi:hypothetical protein